MRTVFLTPLTSYNYSTCYLPGFNTSPPIIAVFCECVAVEMFQLRFLSATGKPNEAVVTSVSNGYYSDHYNLTWSVHCYSKIDQYRISYRKSIVSSMSVSVRSIAILLLDWNSSPIITNGNDQPRPKPVKTCVVAMP